VQEFFSQALLLRCYGVTVGFDTNLPEVLARIGPEFIPASKICKPSSPDLTYSLRLDRNRGRYVVSIGSEELIQTPDLNYLLELLKLHVQRAVAEASTEYVFVHAGAVAWHGKAILLPGRSGSGKSTLVRELISSGAEYLSDEYAVLDEDGFAHPFARPLSIRTPYGRTTWRPQEVGGQTATRRIPVAAVVFSQYEPGGTFRPAYPTPGGAMLDLLENVVAVRANPAKSLRIARSVISSSLVLRSVRGEASRTVTALFRLMTSMASGRFHSDLASGEKTCIQLPEQQG
jgi:hypothetical protein